jgi:hypothetical protein
MADQENGGGGRGRKTKDAPSTEMLGAPNEEFLETPAGAQNLDESSDRSDREGQLVDTELHRFPP